MHNPNDGRSQWVRREVARHTTPDGMRRRIARETEQIRILEAGGFTSGPMAKALEAHRELIRVLTERLADLQCEQTEKKSAQNG